MPRSHNDLEAVVIGLFPRASDARRALNILREHHFSADEAAAAFRDPAPARVEPRSVPVSGSAHWFGQLRQIYHGDDHLENTQPGGGTQTASADFDTMLSQLDLSSQDALVLNRDLDRGAAIVTVTAGSRNPEARALLEQYGARIVHSHSPKGQVTAPGPGAVVTSTPFTSPREADPEHIQLFGEVLRVRKEKVDSGEVHVRKESVTQIETVQVPVTREQLVVERYDESGRTAPEDSIRVPLSEERVHIDKDTVLREEYKVGKREVTQNELVSDRVRRERLLIDDASARNGTQSNTDEIL
jgi:uncharacterized protein (TIGR02271 family)